MNCMKCGKEIPATQVFCDSCLAVMDRYPVKPDIHVQLPHRDSSQKKAPSRKPEPTTKEKLLQSRKIIKRLVLALVCALLALVLSVTLLLYTCLQKDTTSNIGKNYNTTDTRTE